MPSKNDLSALKSAQHKPTILPSNDAPPVEQVAVKPKTGQGVGRPPKGKTEKRSVKITLSLTEAEGTKISQQAGLAGDATFLYAKLKEHGII